MVTQLDERLWFPNPYWGEEDGLVAIGGDLSIDRLLLAYSNGFFPWYAYQMEGEPHWYCPIDRFVIFPNEIHISHSMRQLMRQHLYEVTINQDFEGVIRGCSKAQGRNEECGAWLGPDIIDAYTDLHHLGFAASVEVWEKSPADGANPEASSSKSPADGANPKASSSDAAADHRLVGGLYGVTLRHAFFGESMFSLVPSASKLALIHLALAMQRVGGRFIDCQFETSHLLSMGGRHISYEEYMQLLNQDKP